VPTQSTSKNLQRRYIRRAPGRKFELRKSRGMYATTQNETREKGEKDFPTEGL
jgi:hypothetical protein